MNKKIAYITDIHLGESFPKELNVDCRKNWKIILDDIKKRNIKQIIFGGDIGNHSSHSYFFESLKDFELDISLGNHDNFKAIKTYLNVFKSVSENSLYYSKDYEHHKLVFLDSSKEVLDEEQFKWFKEQLVTDKIILLFIHHPILEIDALVDQKYALKEREKLNKELIAIDNQIMIFCGHYHFEDISRAINVTQYITCASSYQVEKLPNKIKINTDNFGYRIIEILPTKLNTKQILFFN